MRFQDQDVVELARGASRLRVAPQAGGRLLSWTIAGAPVLYWPDAPDWSQPGGIRGGNPLLFPFIARHWVDGEMGAWRDASGTVREMPLHGFARDLPFAADVAPEGDGVRVTLADSAATRERYPFGFRFEAAYRLREGDALDVDLITTNTGDTPLPYYAGHHFYFALPHAERARTTITLPRNAWRRQLPDGATTEATPGARRYRLDDAQIVDRFHCLDGAPDAPVRIEMPSQGRAIEIDLSRPGSTPWYAVTTWTLAPDCDFYCVEPWLGLPDAIHTGLGLRWLKPGETQRAALRITVSAWR
ncbi:aldose epimerase family protein [Paraburkholderia acidisoli]|uniref:Aldose epimerase n=1 Tax=Paraburkholderia acidisoli TaxID=2571748 RepID=A0A7Z2JIG8_9BURK|nr:aldose epimerase [Paraburkholderia acidisoli]QGZ64344.1 aldose epimerase [Paraburkholderia acidisoli]